MPLNSFGLIFCLCCSKLPLSLLTPELWSCSTLTHCMITRYKAKYFHLDSIRPLFLMMCCTARTRTLKHIARVRATIKKFTNILGRHRRQPIMWIIVFVHSNNPQTGGSPGEPQLSLGGASRCPGECRRRSCPCSTPFSDRLAIKLQLLSFPPPLSFLPVLLIALQHSRGVVFHPLPTVFVLT